MIGPSHIIVGAAAGVVFVKLTGIYPAPPEVLLLLAGSLAPDIDGAGSITRPSRFFRGILPRFCETIVDTICSGISGVIRGTFGHRGFFHWPLVATLFLVSALYVHSSLFFWFSLGYLSHILADFVTIGGIPFFAPISKRRYSLKLFPTGSKREFLLVGIITIACAYFGFSLLPIALQNELRSLGQAVVAHIQRSV